AATGTTRRSIVRHVSTGRSTGSVDATTSRVLTGSCGIQVVIVCLSSEESGVAGAAADGAAAAVPAPGRRAARPAHLELHLQLGGGPVRGEVDGQGGQRVRERGWHAAGGGHHRVV